MLAASRQHGLEGVLAKRLASTYQPGLRSRDWIKVKNMRTVQPSSAAGPPAGSRRSGGIGALLLGLPDGTGTGTGQRHIGHVGTGLSAAELADLATRLAGLARDHPPFTAGLTRQAAQQAHSVQPVLVAEIAFAEWTPQATLRHPAWRGLRPAQLPDPCEPQ